MSYASYQVVAPEGEPTNTSNLVPDGQRPVTIRSGGGVVSFQGGEATEVGGHASINTSDLIGEVSQGLTVRTPWGSPVGGDLKPTDVVTVAGHEMTVAVAERLNLIERGAYGQYVLVPQGAEALTQEAPEAPVDEGEALPNAAIEQDLGDLCASITPSTQVALAQQLISNGEINANTLARAAGESSIEPGVLNERINTVVESFQVQADATLKGFGADDTSQFYDWARENDPAGLRKAMNDHVMSRSTKGYEPLFRAYVESLADHAPDDVLNAQLGDGITARMVNNQVVLTIPGRGTMTYRSAVKAGLIRVTGA